MLLLASVAVVSAFPSRNAAPDPVSCECVPCGTTIPKDYPDGTCGSPSDRCNAATRNPGCYNVGCGNVTNALDCNCKSKTCDVVPPSPPNPGPRECDPTVPNRRTTGCCSLSSSIKPQSSQ